MIQRQIYELVTFRLVNSGQSVQLDDYLANAALPAYNRLGIEPVGVFRGVYGPDASAFLVLLPHPSIESVMTSRDSLLKDGGFLDSGGTFLEAPFDSPAYLRTESSLLLAFAGMPGIELPEGNLGRTSRLFELRIYESHSLIAHKRKIEMFNEGDEIGVFRRAGLQPVLFGETLIGPRMPNLVYMLTFDGMAHRDEAWGKFRLHPDWIRLRDDPQYADTVSNITDLILKPAACSQI